ncbi:MAG: hypothetical protein JNK74_00105 [Candidatus Hydrogenedentes bacterium]|nr:hypothetical protein [Candidatus Hydrogenedentota bacterium]
MIEYLSVMIIFGIVLLMIIGNPFRSIKNSRDSIQQSFAALDQVIEGVNKQQALDEEKLAQQARLIEQGDETIALLKAIRENLELRSIKN